MGIYGTTMMIMIIIDYTIVGTWHMHMDELPRDLTKQVNIVDG